MKFSSQTEETLFVSEIFPERRYMFNQELKTGLSIIWNTGAKAVFNIDQQKVEIDEHCIIFLTEFHRIDSFEFEKMNVLQFNRGFYCIENHDNEVGCKGLLFFGASSIPKINVPKEKLRQFTLLWEILTMEMDEHDPLKLDMLRILLKRFIILCLRIYKNQHVDLSTDNESIGVIREYNYLVEQHYKTLTRVSDYAKLLHKSPKTLANLFSRFIDKTPLQLINDRRLLEAKRLLSYSSKSLQEIAEEINFSDQQAFSHFFKKHESISPSKFRRSLT